MRTARDRPTASVSTHDTDDTEPQDRQRGALPHPGPGRLVPTRRGSEAPNRFQGQARDLGQHQLRPHAAERNRAEQSLPTRARALPRSRSRVVAQYAARNRPGQPRSRARLTSAAGCDPSKRWLPRTFKAFADPGRSGERRDSAVLRRKRGGGRCYKCVGATFSDRCPPLGCPGAPRRIDGGPATGPAEPLEPISGRRGLRPRTPMRVRLTGAGAPRRTESFVHEGTSSSPR